MDMEQTIPFMGGSSFAIRLAKRLNLTSAETHTFEINSSAGVLTVTIGCQFTEQECVRRHLPRGSRPVHVKGVLHWQESEYEVSIENEDGSGTLRPHDHAFVLDRSFGHRLDGDMPRKVYETILPLIEIEVADILRRARAKKN